MFAFLKKRRIRWLLASTLVILLGGGALLYWYSRGSLADYVDGDLRKLDDTHPTSFGKFLGQILPDQFPGPRTKLERMLKQIMPKEFVPEHEPLRLFVEPWYIWRLKTGNGSRFIFFEAQRLVIIPGASW